MVDVSCILLNYNTAQLSIEAVQSIQQFTDEKVSYEIVLVDNASHWEDYKKLEQFVKNLGDDRVSIHRNRINTGFGAGNMMGVIHSSPCQYYAFINSDVLFLQENTLYDLKVFMDANNEAGICSPQMLGPDKSFRSTLDHFASPARQFLNRGFLEKWNSKRYPDRKKTYDVPLQSDYVQGSFMFVDAPSFNKVGGFDERLFLYYEESDLSKRILDRTGKKTYLFPSQEYIHLQGKSTTKNIKIKMEQKISLLYYIHKHHGVVWHRSLLFYYTIKYLFSSIVKPKHWPLFKLLLNGAPTSKSLAHKQIVLDR